jgi:hypothetical protein
MALPQLIIHPHRGVAHEPEGHAAHNDAADTERGRYLTDGVHLYRAVGTFGEAAKLVGLEDCQSLDVILLAAKEVRRLRPVRHRGARI